MKKNLLFIAAAALIFAACSNNDLRNDLQDEQVGIGFSTFTGKLTRAENSTATVKHALNSHHTAFKVWGYKTVSGTPSSVFGESGNTGTIVSWNNTSSLWEYSPLRFWDKSATNYKFYAAAPSSASWVYENDKISLTGFSVDGASITASAAIDADADFGAQDIMISEDVTVLPANYTSTRVQLNFIHLLTRLNIGVKKAATLSDYTVKLESIKVFNLVDGGDFSEATAANPTGSIARWSANNVTSDDSKAGYGYTTETVVSTSSNYVYQALFIPQLIEYVANTPLNGNGLSGSSKPYLNIQYELWNAAGNQKIDSYSYFYNLADMFNAATDDDVAFNEGWMNTLIITIDPVAINFAAEVYEWKPTTDVEVNVPDIN